MSKINLLLLESLSIADFDAIAPSLPLSPLNRRYNFLEEKKLILRLITYIIHHINLIEFKITLTDIKNLFTFYIFTNRLRLQLAKCAMLILYLFIYFFKPLILNETKYFNVLAAEKKEGGFSTTEHPPPPPPPQNSVSNMQIPVPTSPLNAYRPDYKLNL